MPVEITQKFIRIRLKDPKLFRTFRIHDVGRKGFDKRIAGIRKKTGKWETQAWLISRQGLRKKDPRTVRLFMNIAQELPQKERVQLLSKLA